MRLVNKNTEFFTTEAPEEVFEELLGYFEEKGCKVAAAADKYKLKVTQIISEEPEQELEL